MKTVKAASPFDRHAAGYDRWYDEKDGKIIFATEVKALQEVLPGLPKPWLEAGVGSGRFASALGIRTGIDPSARLLQKAKSRGIITIKGRIEDRIIPLESFGTVFLIMTLCFLDNPGLALREIHRILKPQGKLVLGEVPAYSPWGQLFRQKKRDAHPFYKYANFYTFDDLASMLENAGFDICMTVSTLVQKPGKLQAVEIPLNDYCEDAGFLVIVGVKTKASL